jgi:hypothetical protein
MPEPQGGGVASLRATSTSTISRSRRSRGRRRSTRVRLKPDTTYKSKADLKVRLYVELTSNFSVLTSHLNMRSNLVSGS